MRILGIDPGLERVGYGLIDKVGSKLAVVEYGLISTPRIALPDRLKLISDEVSALISKYEPEACATERLLFAANKTTAMDVSKALGAILVCVSTRGLSWHEYSPPEVKLSVVGNGKADKKQIQFMVTRILGLKETPKPDDVADALAIAICHSFHWRTQQR